MQNRPCKNCEDIINCKKNRRHADLERDGLSKTAAFHGSRDDEYFYRCKVCGTRFIGDSMGTWPQKSK